MRYWEWGVGRRLGAVGDEVVCGAGEWCPHPHVVEFCDGLAGAVSIHVGDGGAAVPAFGDVAYLGGEFTFVEIPASGFEVGRFDAVEAVAIDGVVGFVTAGIDRVGEDDLA